MANIGRNDSCLCGSGKKYKKCCHLSVSTQPKASTERIQSVMSPFFAVEEDLDRVSNSIVDLIDEKRFDEALVVCERLRTEYPEVIDWLERSAMVHEARGENALAADFYRRALAFSEQPEQRPAFDEELRDDYRRRATALEATRIP